MTPPRPHVPAACFALGLPTKNLVVARTGFTAAVPANGRVLVAGGERKVGGFSLRAPDSVELFDGIGLGPTCTTMTGPACGTRPR